MRQLIDWQETWLSENVASYRPQMGCEDIWLSEALLIEEALLAGEPHCWLQSGFV